eukprot:RCo055300
MIDHFTVLHKGGKVLWQKSLVKITGNPINQLIKTVLLEDRGGDSTFTHDSYRLQWLLANEFELVFVVVYQKIIQLLYAEQLLSQVKDAFCTMFQAELSQTTLLFAKFEGFDAAFTRILAGLEASLGGAGPPARRTSPPPGLPSGEPAPPAKGERRQSPKAILAQELEARSAENQNQTQGQPEAEASGKVARKGTLEERLKALGKGSRRDHGSKVTGPKESK